MSAKATAHLAVLIDADNTSPKIAEGLFEEIAKIGEASVRRIYGDFTTPHNRQWEDIMKSHAIIPHQQYAYTKGKNSSDITLVIDAMDLLHSGRVDGFCLVSSDSDFTRLASRIREQGMDVYGFGAQKTPESLRQACKKFFYTENLIAAEDAEKSSAKTKPLLPLPHAVKIIKKAVEETDDAQGWADLGHVGNHLAKTKPDFDSRNYGIRQLSSLVEKSGAFDIETTADKRLRIRIKSAAGTKGK